MLRISELSKVASDTEGVTSGVVLGETIMLHAPAGSKIYNDLTNGVYSGFYYKGDVFIPRHWKVRVISNESGFEAPDFYTMFKDTPMIEHDLSADAISPYATKTQTNLLDMTIDADYNNLQGTYVGVAGICTDSKHNIYVLAMGSVTPPAKTISLFRCNPGGGTDGTVTALWRSNSYGTNTYYTEPVYTVSHGIEYITFTGNGNVRTDYLYDIQKNIMHANRSLRDQTPYRYFYDTFQFVNTGRAVNYNHCERNQIYEINGVLVADFIKPGASYDTEGTKIYTSSNGLDWLPISDIHYKSVDPANPAYGWFGTGHKIEGYFKDTINNRLCAICVPNKSNGLYIIYYTDNGTVWKQGITVRTDRTLLTWDHDTDAPGVELGDDVLWSVELCGEVVYVDGYWYVGWVNAGTDVYTAPMLTRFSNYTLTGSSNLTHAIADVETRTCMRIYDTGGPPETATRCAVAKGFLLQNDEWVALWKPDPTRYNLGYWYITGGNQTSLSWNSYDGYDDAPNKIMAKSDIPAYFNALIANPTSPDFSAIPDYEIRTVEMAKCFNTANTALTDITLDQAVHGTRKVKGAGNNLMYTAGTVEARYALNFSNSGHYASEGEDYFVTPLPGYNSSWDTLFPVTRVI